MELRIIKAPEVAAGEVGVVVVVVLEMAEVEDADPGEVEKEGWYLFVVAHFAFIKLPSNYLKSSTCT